jgi:hypothetical protein
MGRFRPNDQNSEYRKSPKLIDTEFSKFTTFCFSRHPKRTQNSKELKVQSSWLWDLNWNHPHEETLNKMKIVLHPITNRMQQDTPENTKLQEKMAIGHSFGEQGKRKQSFQ